MGNNNSGPMGDAGDDPEVQELIQQLQTGLAGNGTSAAYDYDGEAEQEDLVREFHPRFTFDERNQVVLDLPAEKMVDLATRLEDIKSSPEGDVDAQEIFNQKLKLNHTKNTIREKVRQGSIRLEAFVDMECLEENKLDRSKLIDDKLKKDVTRHRKQKAEQLLKRWSLPACSQENKIVEMVAKQQVTVISGDTGCGKSTQVPQFILDAKLRAGEGSVCRILCTQPRRISTISVAERVARERGEDLAKTKGNGETSVGYQIRFNAVKPRREGSITYCTTGVILMWMRDNPLLHGYSHVILDEVHERDIHTDLLMGVLKELIQVRQDLKVILMSATLNADQFSNYFNGAGSIKIPGRIHPVTEFYMEEITQMLPKYRAVQTDPQKPEVNSGLIADLVKHLHRNKGPGSILIFVPGWGDISAIMDLLAEEETLSVYPLHSTMIILDQKGIFEPAEKNKRKVIVSTNLAETSITIEDVVYVIDSGTVNVKEYNIKRHINELKVRWEARANATQRKGRAGRVQPGECYRMYSKTLETATLKNGQEAMPDFIKPEMKRIQLEDVVLKVKALALGKAHAFLSQMMSAPEKQAIDNAVSTLTRMDALDAQEQLTPLGFNLSKIPIEPQHGRMLLYSILLGCFDPVLTIVSVLDGKDPLQMPKFKGKQEKKQKQRELDEIRRQYACDSDSDHFLWVNVFNRYMEVYEDAAKKKNYNILKRFCRENFLNEVTLDTMYKTRKQLAHQLHADGFIPSKNSRSKVNVYSEDLSMIRTAICAGLYPNVIHKKHLKVDQPQRGLRLLKSPDNLYTHPKSVNHMKTNFCHDWIAFYQMQDTSKCFIFESTAVPEISLCLFGETFNPSPQPIQSVHRLFQKVTIGDGEGIRKIQLNVDPQLCPLIKKMRDALNDVFKIVMINASKVTWEENARETKLKRKKGFPGEREVKQFHYTSWPDHGVPGHPLPVLSFIKKSAEANPPEPVGGPIVVHCSAGVGRTGTYIAIDTMLRQMKTKGLFNIFGFLKHIRRQRNYLVQTEEQYAFIHDALLEATKTGGVTEVEAPKLQDHLKDLDCPVEEVLTIYPGNEEKADGKTLLEQQFQLITAFQPSSDFHYLSAKKACNASKNASATLLPIENSRVALAPKPGIEGSDYINATWLHGHHELREFVISQHPGEDTRGAFWRMLWDHNAQTIVLLTPLLGESNAPNAGPVFWPQIDDEFDYDTFRVRYIEQATHEGHSTLDFVLSSCQDDYELTVRIIHCADWPHNVQETQEVFDVLKLVQDWHLEYQRGALVVVDQFGGTEAATFCALTTLCNQLETDHGVDVYQVAKLYHSKRPGIWKDKEDIRFLYKAMQALIASNHVNPVCSTNNQAHESEATAAQSQPASGSPHKKHSKEQALVNGGGGGGGGSGSGGTVLLRVIPTHQRRHSMCEAAGCSGGGGNDDGNRRYSLPPSSGSAGGESSEGDCDDRLILSDHDAEKEQLIKTGQNNGCALVPHENGSVMNGVEDDDVALERCSETVALTASM